MRVVDDLGGMRVLLGLGRLREEASGFQVVDQLVLRFELHFVESTSFVVSLRVELHDLHLPQALQALQ